jgi:hypothetical protein
MIALAAEKGHPEAIQLLLDAGANVAQTFHPPLLETLKRGNRLALAVLLEGRTEELLNELHGHILAWHAAKTQSSLLPEIALATQEAIREHAATHPGDVPEFPPAGLSRTKRTLLLDCLKLNQKLESTDAVKQAIRQIKTIWV